MHSEYVSASVSKRCDELELEQPEAEQPAGRVALGEFADAFGDPPPHAANTSPRATRPAPGAARRQCRRPLVDV
jgi:hypothetical protein